MDIWLASVFHSYGAGNLFNFHFFFPIHFHYNSTPPPPLYPLISISIPISLPRLLESGNIDMSELGFSNIFLDVFLFSRMISSHPLEKSSVYMFLNSELKSSRFEALLRDEIQALLFYRYHFSLLKPCAVKKEGWMKHKPYLISWFRDGSLQTSLHISMYLMNVLSIW